MEGNQGRIEIDKQLFVDELKKIRVGSTRTRDSQLRKLVGRYRDRLGGCTDEIPCDLERFGFPHGTTMSFDNFIYEITGRT